MKRQIVYFISGLILVIISIPLNVYAKLGCDPLSSLSTSISKASGITFGTILILLNIIFIMIHLLYFKNLRYAIIAFSCSLATGIGVDLINLIIKEIPNNLIYQKIIILLSAYIIMCFGVALIQKSHFQKMAFESFQEVLSKIFKKDINFIRVIVEILCVLCAFLIFEIFKIAYLDYINFGTLFMMFSTGPGIYLVYKKILKGE